VKLYFALFKVYSLLVLRYSFDCPTITAEKKAIANYRIFLPITEISLPLIGVVYHLSKITCHLPRIAANYRSFSAIHRNLLPILRHFLPLVDITCQLSPLCYRTSPFNSNKLANDSKNTLNLSLHRKGPKSV